MKKSELKAYIKETIISELSEVDTDKTRGTVVMSKATQPQAIKKMTDQGLDVELKEEEDFDAEPTAKDIAANSSMTKLQTKYGQVVKQMQSVLGQYKKAEGTEKSKFLDQLKDLTKIKKELEAMLNPSIDDEDEE